jgi:proton glutamate symport protein
LTQKGILRLAISTISIAAVLRIAHLLTSGIPDYALLFTSWLALEVVLLAAIDRVTSFKINAILVFALFTLSLALHLVHSYATPIPDLVLAGSRWITLGAIGSLAFKKNSLTGWIIASMFIGCEVGYIFPTIATNLDVLSSIFLRLIKTIIAPLIFSTLVVGIAAHSNLKQVGRMGWKAILYFELVTTVALFIGLAAINLTRAGEGAEMNPQQAQIERAEKLKAQEKTKDQHHVILDIFPENIAKAVAENYVLQVVVFSVLFGIGLAKITDEAKKKPMLSFAESLSEIMFKFTDIVMYVAPFAVGGALAYSVATFGFGMLKNLFMLVGTLYMALTAFILLVLVPIGVAIKLPFRKFIRAISEPVSIAFATSTSEAALPSAMENLGKFGVPRKIISFVLPTGYSFNLDGSTLYLSLASVFVAQATGVDLTFGQQVYMVFILMLTSKGVAGVRGASFLILVSTLDTMGLDSQKATAILAVDAIMDMGRTTVNVIGNCLATVVVAKWEGEYSVTAGDGTFD